MPLKWPPSIDKHCPTPSPPKKKKLLSFSPSPPQKKTHGHWTSSTATRTLCRMGENHEKGERLSISGILLPEKLLQLRLLTLTNTTTRTGSWSIKIYGKQNRPKTEKGKGIVIFQLSFFQGRLLLVFKGVKQMESEISQFRSGFFMCFCCWLWDFERMLRCKPYMRRRQYDVIWWYDMKWYDDMICNDKTCRQTPWR